jgi:hypothetical protein
MALSKASASARLASATPSSRSIRSRRAPMRRSAPCRTETAQSIAASASRTPLATAAKARSGAFIAWGGVSSESCFPP